MEEKKLNQSFADYVHLLRWGPARHADPTRPRLKISRVASMLQISTHKVRRLLKQAGMYMGRKRKIKMGPQSKLKPHHIEFLTRAATLQAWGARSLAERLVLFHR